MKGALLLVFDMISVIVFHLHQLTADTTSLFSSCAISAVQVSVIVNVASSAKKSIKDLSISRARSLIYSRKRLHVFGKMKYVLERLNPQLVNRVRSGHLVLYGLESVPTCSYDLFSKKKFNNKIPKLFE